eukprot:403364119
MLIGQSYNPKTFPRSNKQTLNNFIQDYKSNLALYFLEEKEITDSIRSEQRFLANLEFKYFEINQNQEDKKKKEIFDQIFVQDPDMKRIAKKFNHRKFKIYYDTHPDQLKMFESIKQRKQQYEELMLQKEQQKLQKSYNEKVLDQQKNSQGQDFQQQKQYHHYFDPNIADVSTKENIQLSNRPKSKEPNSSFQTSKQGSPDKFEKRLTIIQRQAMISKLKEAISNMESNSKNVINNQSESQRGNRVQSRNFTNIDDQDNDLKHAFITSQSDKLKVQVKQFLIKTKSQPIRENQQDDDIKEEDLQNQSDFYKTLQIVKQKFKQSPLQNKKHQHQRSQSKIQMSKFGNLPPRPVTNQEIRTNKSKKSLKILNLDPRKLNTSFNNSKRFRQTQTIWNQVKTEPITKKRIAQKLNISCEIKKLQSAQNSLERLIMLDQQNKDPNLDKNDQNQMLHKNQFYNTQTTSSNFKTQFKNYNKVRSGSSSAEKLINIDFVDTYPSTNFLATTMTTTQEITIETSPSNNRKQKFNFKINKINDNSREPEEIWLKQGPRNPEYNYQKIDRKMTKLSSSVGFRLHNLSLESRDFQQNNTTEYKMDFKRLTNKEQHQTQSSLNPKLRQIQSAKPSQQVIVPFKQQHQTINESVNQDVDLIPKQQKKEKISLNSEQKTKETYQRNTQQNWNLHKSQSYKKKQMLDIQPNQMISIDNYIDVEKQKIKVRRTLNGFYKSKKLIIKVQ